MAPTKERPATKSIATNREARHEYFVLEALETGVELKGTEVKKPAGRRGQPEGQLGRY